MNLTLQHILRIPKAHLGSVLLLLVVLPDLALAAPYYNVGGLVSTWADFGDSEYRQVVSLAQTTLYDEALSLGKADDTGLINSGWAGNQANLVTGTLGAFALANNSYGLFPGYPPGYWNQAAASSAVRMGDDLYFDIMPGVYVDALVVTLYGRVGGYLSASGWYGAGGDFYASLLGPDAVGVQAPAGYTGAIGQCWPAACNTNLTNGQIGIDQLFQLTAVLVAAGSEVSEDLTVGMHVELGLGQARTVSAGQSAGSMGVVPPYSYADSRFDQTLSIYAMDVPAGVAWTSSSGVFLTQISQPVAEPSTLALMVAGVGLLGWSTGHRFKRPQQGRRRVW
jgi:hypothetical protein